MRFFNFILSLVALGVLCSAQDLRYCVAYNGSNNAVIVDAVSNTALVPTRFVGATPQENATAFGSNKFAVANAVNNTVTFLEFLTGVPTTVNLPPGARNPVTIGFGEGTNAGVPFHRFAVVCEDTRNVVIFDATNINAAPTVSTVENQPHAITFINNVFFVANQGSSSVSAIQSDFNVTTITLTGGAANPIAITGGSFFDATAAGGLGAMTFRVLTANRASNSVTILNVDNLATPTQNHVTTFIGNNPFAASFGNSLFAVLCQDGTLSLLNIATQTPVISPIAIPNNPAALAFGNNFFATANGTAVAANHVTLVDTLTAAFTQTNITLGGITGPNTITYIEGFPSAGPLIQRFAVTGLASNNEALINVDRTIPPAIVGAALLVANTTSPVAVAFGDATPGQAVLVNDGATFGQVIVLNLLGTTNFTVNLLDHPVLNGFAFGNNRFGVLNSGATFNGISIINLFNGIVNHVDTSNGVVANGAPKVIAFGNNKFAVAHDNATADNIVLVDSLSGAILGFIQEAGGINPSSIAFGNNRFAVGTSGSNEVIFIDAINNIRTTRVALGSPADAIVFSQNRFAVVSFNVGVVTFISAVSNKIVGSLSFGGTLGQIVTIGGGSFAVLDQSINGLRIIDSSFNVSTTLLGITPNVIATANNLILAADGTFVKFLNAAGTILQTIRRPCNFVTSYNQSFFLATSAANNATITAVDSSNTAEIKISETRNNLPLTLRGVLIVDLSLPLSLSREDEEK